MSASAANAGPVVVASDALTRMRSSLDFIMIAHTFLTLLLPLLIALFYFSTPHSRQCPLFTLNVMVIILAFVEGIMTDALAIHSLLYPQNPWHQWVDIAIGIIGIFQSLLVDFILFVRLISVHTLRNIGPTRFTVLMALPFLLKLTRVINLILFIQALAEAAHGVLGPEGTAAVWVTTPYLKIEWTSQTADNIYASLAFLCAIKDWGHSQGMINDTGSSRCNLVTFPQRIHALFRIMLSSFIIPTVFSIVQLVIVYRNVDMHIVNEITLVNSMLSVFGVTFATAWARRYVGLRDASQIDLWDDGSQMDNCMAKHDPHRAELHGIHPWRVASPPEVTEESVEIQMHPARSEC